MTTPSGASAISFEDINTELGLATNSELSFDDFDLRALARKKLSESISLEDCKGKSASVIEAAVLSNINSTIDSFNYGQSTVLKVSIHHFKYDDPGQQDFQTSRTSFLGADLSQITIETDGILDTDLLLGNLLF